MGNVIYNKQFSIFCGIGGVGVGRRDVGSILLVPAAGVCSKLIFSRRTAALSR